MISHLTGPIVKPMTVPSPSASAPRVRTSVAVAILLVLADYIRSWGGSRPREPMLDIPGLWLLERLERTTGYAFTGGWSVVLLAAAFSILILAVAVHVVRRLFWYRRERPTPAAGSATPRI